MGCPGPLSLGSGVSEDIGVVMKRIIILIIAGFTYHQMTPTDRARAWDYVEGQAKYWAWEGIEQVGAWVEGKIEGKVEEGISQCQK
jgi:hypothetical protein